MKSVVSSQARSCQVYKKTVQCHVSTLHLHLVVGELLGRVVGAALAATLGPLVGTYVIHTYILVQYYVVVRSCSTQRSSYLSNTSLLCQYQLFLFMELFVKILICTAALTVAYRLFPSSKLKFEITNHYIKYVWRILIVQQLK